MSDYLRLSPSGLAIASENDTFLTQLMNDNIRHMDRQLPCLARVRVDKIYAAGSALGVVSAAPLVVGAKGPFLGILNKTPDRDNTAVLQLAGLARVPVQAGEGSFLRMEDGKAVIGSPEDIGSDNYIGNVVATVDAGGTTGKPAALVLLRSWCGTLGYTSRKSLVPAGGLGADGRQQASSFSFVGAVVNVNTNSASGDGLVESGGQWQGNNVRFRLARSMTCAFAQVSDANYKADVSSGYLTVSRPDGKRVEKVSVYLFGTTRVS